MSKCSGMRASFQLKWSILSLQLTLRLFYTFCSCLFCYTILKCRSAFVWLSSASCRFFSRISSRCLFRCFSSADSPSFLNAFPICLFLKRSIDYYRASGGKMIIILLIATSKIPMRSSVANNLGISSRRPTSGTMMLNSKTQSLVSLQENLCDKLPSKRLLPILFSQQSNTLRRNNSHDQFISTYSQKQDDLKRKISNKIYFQKRNEIQSLFKERQWMRKLQIKSIQRIKPDLDKQKEEQLTGREFQRENQFAIEKRVVTEEDGVQALQLGLEQEEDDFSQKGGLQPLQLGLEEEEDDLEEGGLQPVNLGLEEEEDDLEEGGLVQNQLRLGIFDQDEVSLLDEEAFEVEFDQKEPSIQKLCIGLDSFSEHTLYSNDQALTCEGIKRNINRSVQSFEQESESALLDFEGLSLSNKEDYSQDDPYDQANLKILNFESIFGDEIHEDDFLQYEFQDKLEVKVEYHNEKHLQLKGIIKTSAAVEDEKEEKVVKKVGLGLRVPTEENQQLMDHNSSNLSIELMDNPKKPATLPIVTSEFANYHTLNTCKVNKQQYGKTVHFDDKPNVMIFRKGQKCLSSSEMNQGSKLLLVMTDEDESESEEGEDMSWLHLDDNGSTTSRNSKNSQVELEVEKALFDMKLDEVKRDNKVGVSTFSLYYDRAMARS